MAKPDQIELNFIADRLVEKLWQGDEARRGTARQAASIALAAIQDYTATRYMETADKFTGRSLMQLWLNREARASVALDKGDGETQSVEGAYTRKPSDLVTTEPGPPTETVGEVKGTTLAINDGAFPGWMRTGRFEGPRDVSDFLAKQVEDGATIEHPDGWRDDL